MSLIVINLWYINDAVYNSLVFLGYILSCDQLVIIYDKTEIVRKACCISEDK